MKKFLTKFFEVFNKIPKDKLLHFIAGLLMFCASLIVLLILLPKGSPAEYISFVVVFIAAILKETWIDRKIIEGTPEVEDATITILGGLFGLLMSLFT